MSSTIQNSTEALKHLHEILDALKSIRDLYGEGEEGSDEEEGADHYSEQEMVDRVVEEAGELGMNEDDTEKVFKIMLSFCKKEAE